ncbi:ditrans polycis-undecaprenyl-diphosphate synthase ((2E 6E)-farnesyl-diphosphate specific) [endosymbiont of Euscepes postfasciatus]|uniref:polyprenyl diphosphate synthase n=1 Tax=endosymbiont of Euscepes postfasciatus TaxID=650377 RepID=UPI000DC70BE8|nr:ditrans polycis-undecaprenyl-diphosphate synthase ((2E 6E)-farnesyl-diphosphate specific) [endosymbiont of Euscepes postfasciatus]
MNRNLYLNKLKKIKNIINHVAIIADGNGRWANINGKSRYFGHKEGLKSIMKIINISIYYHIKALTLYVFSTENWKRPETEVNYLMDLFKKTLKKQIYKLNNKNIKLNIIGEKIEFNKELRTYIYESENITKNNTGLILNIAANYGGKWDIIQCIKKIFYKIKNKKISIEDINESIINKNISTYNSPPIDLLIRTGGELRISNFLLWQIAYSELYFTKTLWPDFDKFNFEEALISFYKRTRKFGNLINKG